MSDLISRQALLDQFDLMDRLYVGAIKVYPENNVRLLVENLPSAEPEREKGKWIIKAGKHICPICGSGYGNAQLPYSFSYCPNCGVKMEKTDE